MKRCCCIGFSDTDKLNTISKIGFECVEPGLSAIAAQSEQKVREFRNLTDSLGLACASFNGLLPGEIALFGPYYDKNALESYLERAFYYASVSGTHVVTLGSGRSRNIPEGVTKERAEDQFRDILRSIFVPIARKNGLSVGIEPLRREECNFLNSCAEIMNVVNDVNEPEINLTVDVFHAYLSGESCEDMTKYGERIKHVHISSVRNLRMYPAKEDAGDIRALYGGLKSSGYSGAISIEGICQGDFEASAAEAFNSISLSF